MNDNNDLIFLVNEACTKRNLSSQTTQRYLKHQVNFVKQTGKQLDELTLQDAADYLDAARERNVKASTYNFYNSSLHFLYRNILRIPWDTIELPRMRRDYPLPYFISREEIEAIIDTADNIRDKAMFALMYSAGLRVSEIRDLNYSDISRSNMTVHIHHGKNDRERYTILSERCLELLTDYWFAFDKPREALFVTIRKPRTRLSSGAIEAALRKIRNNLDMKRVTCHTLRHSFATHLLENGADIHDIQALLGHADPRTTEIYLHTTNKYVKGIISPFDSPKPTKGGGTNV